MLISIIIPVYKVEKYLAKCLDSLLTQTYKQLEVILVDDGSPDGSSFICNEYVKKDSRVRYFYKNNGGAASARNYGVKYAKGEYIIFVDGDDFWRDERYLHELVNVVQANKDLDFIGFNCSYYVYPNKYKQWVSYSKSILEETDKNILTSEIVKCGVFPMSPCLKVIKKKTLFEKHIMFPEGITGEDIPWFIDLLDKSNSFKFINLYVYAYRQDNLQSMTHNFTEKSFDNFMYILSSELDKLQSRSFKDDTKKILKSYFAYLFIVTLARIYELPKQVRKQKREQILKYKWLLQYTDNPRVKKISIINKFFGIYITEKLLNLFMLIK